MKPKPKNGKHLIARNDALDAKIKKRPYMDKDVETLSAMGRRNLKLIRILYASVALEIILTGAVAYFASQTIISKNRTEINHVAIVRSCESGNGFRKDNLALWTYILALPTQQPLTDAQKDVAADFTTFVNKTFALHDCSQIE